MANYNAGNKKCALCNGEFGVNNVCNSKEHIIPSSLGGKDTVTDFICEKCNNETGNDWDASLCNDLKPVTLYAGVRQSRKKKNNKIILTSDVTETNYLLGRNGNLTPMLASIENTGRYEVKAKASDNKSLRNIQKICK